jgi:hypothetical protein
MTTRRMTRSPQELRLDERYQQQQAKTKKRYVRREGSLSG